MNTTKNVYCRLCAELKPYNELTDLQTEEKTCQKVVNKLSRFNIVINFQENILPKTVCLICVKSLEQAFAFVTAVEQAEAFLSELNLVQTGYMKSDSYGEIDYYVPSDVSEEVIDFNSRDPMDVNDNDDAECDDEDNCNVHNADGNNLGSEKVHIENKDTRKYSDVIGEEKIDIKDETDEYAAVNNDKNIEENESLDFSYVPSDVSEDVIDVNSQDLVDVNDNNDDEECDNQDYCNVYNADGNNLSSEKVHIENKDTRQYSYVIGEEKIGIKDETDEYTDVNNVENIGENESLDFSYDCRENHYINVKENDLNIKDTKVPSALKENLRKDILLTENISESIPPLNNSVNCADYINKQNYSTVGSNVRNIHNQTISKPTPPKVLDTTVYSEDYINKQINRLSIVPVQYLKMTWMDYEWKCSHCGTVFSNIEELQKHSMLYHNTCNAYQCTDCKIKKQRLNAFITHVRSHRKYLHYSCYKCFEKFPKTMETIHHKTKIHENSKHICLGCNTPFSSNTELEEHVNKYYNILWRPRIFINSDNLTCTTCNKVCANVTALRYHLTTHKEKKRDRVCDRCGKCFDREPSLRTHMNIHSGIKPFTCDICSKRFRTKAQIAGHMKFHTDYFPITCSVCNKKFRTDTYLRNHMLQHTGEKPFSCDICPRDFTNLANRNKHMRRIHAIEMGKKRQPIIKQQTADDPTSSDLATGDAKFADLDKTNEWKHKIMEHRKSQRANKNIKKQKVK